MRYTVIWQESAEAELAEIWLNAADRDAVTRASYEIDQHLRFQPHSTG